jgi:ankyrin repeat protein
MQSFLLDSNQRSPFHYAATAGSLQCCEELIVALQSKLKLLTYKFGLLDLPIDQKDRFGQTALMVTVFELTKMFFFVVRSWIINR